MFDQVIPAGGSQADAEGSDDIATQAAALQVINGVLRLRVVAQLVAVKFRGGLQHIIEWLVVLSWGVVVAVFARHVDAGRGGEGLNGLDKAHVLIVHEEAECATGGTATEAVIKLLVLTNAERRGFFAVEGAAGHEILALFLQRHTRVDDINDVDATE